MDLNFFINPFQTFFFFKILIFIASFFLVIFSLVVFSQVKGMNRIIRHSTSSTLLEVISLGIIVVSILLLLLGIIVL